MVTASDFQEMILDNKDKLTKIDFKAKVENEKDYKFIIDKVLKSSLEVIIFIRYEDMLTELRWKELGIMLPGYPIERKLKALISDDAETVFDLKTDTKIKKPNLFKKLIPVKIEDATYKFKITGAGEYAVKLSIRVSFKDIYSEYNPKNNPLENKLINIIYYICTDKKQTWDMDLFQIIKLLN